MDFFPHIFENCDGYIEFRAMVKKKVIGRDWFRTDSKDIIGWIEKYNDTDVFFGVATRKQGKGTKNDIIQIPTLWCDVDFKQTPKDEVVERLKRFPFKPSIGVETGGGWHLYWMLSEPLEQGDIQAVESCVRKIAYALGGDPGALDASRVLRVPGTVNVKYDPPRQVKVFRDNPYTYELSNFNDLAQPPDDWGLRTSRPEIAEADRKRLDKIMNCSFMKHCRDDAATLPEPLWYAMISCLAHQPGGKGLIHELSKPYPNYSKKETDEKILHALDFRPHTCRKIRSMWDCGIDCGVGSPAKLANIPTGDEPAVNIVNNVSDVIGVCNRKRTVSKNGENHKQTVSDVSANGAVDWAIDVDKFIENWGHGEFTVSDIFGYLGVRNREHKNSIHQVLHRRSKKGVIEKVHSGRGRYRIVDIHSDDIDIFNVEDTYHPILLPFNLHKMVRIMPGNIIVVAGEPNAGKTALALNIVELNLPGLTDPTYYTSYCTVHSTGTNKKNGNRGIPEIVYFSSEMGPLELRDRLSAFERPLDDWKGVRFKSRVVDFQDVIQPDAVNIIDFLEIHNEFYRVGEYIRQIHDKLIGRAGIAVICLQKNKGAETGLGGYRSLEKARLALNLSADPPNGAILKIAKAKNFNGSDNPNGKQIRFKLRGGALLTPVGDWHYKGREPKPNQSAYFEQASEAFMSGWGDQLRPGEPPI